MIKTTCQNWNIGQTVKVGFLSLIVCAAIETPGDSAPDAYVLKNLAGTKLYSFMPHNGVRQISLDEASDMMAAQRRIEAARTLKQRYDAELGSKIELLFVRAG